MPQTPSLAQLKEALSIQEQIEQLQTRLRSLLAAAPQMATSLPSRGQRSMSAEARARIAEAQRARWAKQKGTSANDGLNALRGKKAKRTMSPEARAKIAAAQRARWAAKRKS